MVWEVNEGRFVGIYQKLQAGLLEPPSRDRGFATAEMQAYLGSRGDQ